jgi:NADH-quinone oxidoreductase subunit A
VYLGLLLLFNNLKVIFVPIFIQKIDTMQSDQLNYIPILMQFVLAVGFVVGTIIVSGKLGPKDHLR